MNIFFTDINPTIAAQNLCTIHINSQIKESAQMLSTVLRERLTLEESENLYKPTHSNHPCNRWLRESDSNVTWLIDHAKAIANLYKENHNKIHGVEKIIDLVENLF